MLFTWVGGKPSTWSHTGLLDQGIRTPVAHCGLLVQSQGVSPMAFCPVKSRVRLEDNGGANVTTEFFCTLVDRKTPVKYHAPVTGKHSVQSVVDLKSRSL